jgi:[ribosomal protein S18]-alanine N-acetyltransferase
MPALSKKIVLQPAGPPDALAIAELSRDLIETGLGWRWTPARVSQQIHDPETLVLTARSRGILIGFNIMNFGMETAHLSLFAVHRDWQRHGIGRQMFEWARTSAVTAGIALIRLELRADNRDASAFYRALGFREAGWAPGYYSGRETALRMQLDLRREIQRSQT